MAGRIKAALGSLAFLVLAPGGVAGLMPWLIAHWRPLPPSDGPGALRWTGLILIAAGLAVVLEAFARFASWGVALYGVVIAAAFHTFVRLYEEPTLRRAYGEEYAAYCAATPPLDPPVQALAAGRVRSKTWPPHPLRHCLTMDRWVRSGERASMIRMGSGSSRS